MISGINTKRIRAILPAILLTFSFFLPIISYAQDTGIVYECPPTKDPVTGKDLYGNCGFGDLIVAVNNVVSKVRDIALEISVIVLAIAGFKYMTSGGNASKRTEANKMLLNVVYGIIFILAAWLIVNLITTTLIPDIDTFMK